MLLFEYQESSISECAFDASKVPDSCSLCSCILIVLSSISFGFVLEQKERRRFSIVGQSNCLSYLCSDERFRMPSSFRNGYITIGLRPHEVQPVSVPTFLNLFLFWPAPRNCSCAYLLSLSQSTIDSYLQASAATSMVGFRGLLNKAFHATHSKFEVLFSHPADPVAYAEYSYEASMTYFRANSPVNYQQYYHLSQLSAPDDISEDDMILGVRNPDPSRGGSLRSSQTLEETTYTESISYESFELQVTDEEEECLERESILSKDGPSALPEPDHFTFGFSEDESESDIGQERQRLPVRPSSSNDRDETATVSGQSSLESFHSAFEGNASLVSSATSIEEQSIQPPNAAAEDLVDHCNSQASQSGLHRSPEVSSISEERKQIYPGETTLSQNREYPGNQSFLDTEPSITRSQAASGLSFTQHTIARLRARNSLAPSNPPFSTRLSRNYAFRYRHMGPRPVHLASQHTVRFPRNQDKVLGPNKSPASSDFTVRVADVRTYYSHRYHRRQTLLSRDWAPWFAKLGKIKSLAETLRKVVEDTTSTPPIMPAIAVKHSRSFGHRHRGNFLDQNWALWEEKLSKVDISIRNLRDAAEDLKGFEEEIPGGFCYV